MDEPPIILDGARVVRYAMLTPRTRGRASVAAAGVTFDLDTVKRLVVAEDMVKGGVFLLHCNEDWESIAVEQYRDAQAAQMSADATYAAAATTAWTAFRPLTPAEQAEVETTRAFLRQIAAEFPNE